MNIVIIGASSGLGDSIARLLPESGDHVWLINRRHPASLSVDDGVHRHWQSIDLADQEAVAQIGRKITADTIDLLIYCAGIWDSSMNPTEVPVTEIYRIMNVNTSSFIATTVCLFDKLTAADKSKVIAIGSIAGLENSAGTNLAYAASKFGMRGAVHGMRTWLRPYNIGVTCISLGSIGADDTDTDRLPHKDIVDLIKTISTLSASSCVKEITMPALSDIKV